MSLRPQFLPSTTKLLRLCFYRRGRWGCLLQCMLGYHTPLGADTPWSRHPPPEQTPWSRHTPGADPPRSRHPPEQTPPIADPPRADTPWSRHPSPGADTPPEQTPPQSRHPLEQTPPPPPQEQKTNPGVDTPRSRHPSLGADTPLEQNPTPPPPIWPLLRTVRILLECILVVQIFHLFPITSDAECCRTICISWPFPQKF